MAHHKLLSIPISYFICICSSFNKYLHKSIFLWIFQLLFMKYQTGKGGPKMRRATRKDLDKGFKYISIQLKSSPDISKWTEREKKNCLTCFSFYKGTNLKMSSYHTFTCKSFINTSDKVITSNFQFIALYKLDLLWAWLHPTISDLHGSSN